ncbi:MAG: hypothetical protein ACHQ4G_03930 [Opitutales bacterium]
MSHALLGIWELIRAETGGENSPELLALRVELHLTAGKYAVRFAGQVADRGRYSVADHTLTLVGVEGPTQGRVIPCLFQQVGNRLRICYGLDGTAPVTFATAAGSSHYLATYRRKP